MTTQFEHGTIQHTVQIAGTVTFSIGIVQCMAQCARQTLLSYWNNIRSLQWLSLKPSEARRSRAHTQAAPGATHLAGSLIVYMDAISGSNSTTGWSPPAIVLVSMASIGAATSIVVICGILRKRVRNTLSV